jgi:hypothetical protein
MRQTSMHYRGLVTSDKLCCYFPQCESDEVEGSGLGNDDSARTVKRDGAEARIILSLRMKVLIP